MSDNPADPSGNTEAFQAFTHAPPEEAPVSKTPWIIAGLVLAVVVVALLTWLTGGTPPG